MAANDLHVRKIGDDYTYSRSDRTELDGRAIEVQSCGSSKESRRSRRSDDQDAAEQPAPQSEQQPFLLSLADRVAELLSALWDRLNSL